MSALLLLLLLQQESSPGWTYLAEKYDADRDGRIVPDEYARSAASFARLDRDGDGVLTLQDFAEEYAALWRNQYMQEGDLQDQFLRSCQEDADPALHRDEFLRCTDAADLNTDGSLDAAEFNALAPGEDAWTKLTISLDPDGNGLIPRAELAAAFDRLDINRDGALVPLGQAELVLPLQPDVKPLALIFGSFT
jgi:Ca2+-binding EF-hand superfamily protein